MRSAVSRFFPRISSRYWSVRCSMRIIDCSFSQQRIQAQDPELLLKRGYSITLKDGKSIRSASQLKAGDIIETRFAEGNIKSEVK